MKLRQKNLLILLALLFILIAIQYLIGRSIVMRSFAELEEEESRRNVGRVLNAISQEVSSLDTIALDWSSSEETYEYVLDKNVEFEKACLTDKTLAEFKLNLILIADTKARVIFGKGYDFHQRQETLLSEFAQERLSPEHPLLQHKRTDSKLSGIILLQKGAMLIVSRPILTSEAKGPIRGTLIMGRFLDEQMINGLSNAVQVKFILRRMDLPALPVDFKSALQALKEKPKIFVLPLSEQIIAGYTLIQDLWGKPVLIAKIETPRDIHLQGRKSVLFIMLSSILVGLIFCLVIILLLERTILSRLSLLSSEVSNIDRTRDLSSRVSIGGSDELGELSTNINKMLVSLEQAQSSLQEMAKKDALTGLLNRREFFQLAEVEISRARRYKHPLSLAIFDLDHFKQINDRYGHQAGDEVLKAFANIILRSSIRNVDLIARYGGEEFAALLPETTLQGAARACDRLRIITANHNFKLPQGNFIHCNVSIGVAARKEEETLDDLVRRTDEALYAAKNSGRNRVCLATDKGICELSSLEKRAE